MLRILIADDHQIVRRAVRDVIADHPGWEVCAEACDGREALELALAEQPDVAVVDVSLPLLNGVALTRRLKQDLPKTKVLLFTMCDDEMTVSAGLSAGARGYLLKADGAGDIGAAIQALGANRTYFSPEISQLLLDAARGERKLTGLEAFTTRELEVAQLLAEGSSNKQIARRLVIAVKTVETHRASVFKKAAVRTAAEFVRFAVKHNLITA